MKHRNRKLAGLLLGAYTLLLSYWMLVGFGRKVTHQRYMYNLKPFDTIRHYLQFDQISSMAAIINLVGNIAVFVPFGLLLPVIFQRGFLRVFLTFLSGLFVLEMTQLLSRRGSLDIDDFILNTIGFIIGYWLQRILRYR